MFRQHSHFLHNCCLKSLPEASREQFCTNFGIVLGACSAHIGVFFAPFYEYAFYINFSAFLGGPLQGGCRRRGRSTLCEHGNIAFWGPEGGFPVCFPHSVQVPVKRPRDSHLSDLSKVTLQVPLDSCTGSFTRGGL